LGSKFGANVFSVSHFEKISFFAKAGAVVKWGKTARIKFIFGVEWEKHLKFAHFKLAPMVNRLIPTKVIINIRDRYI